ncbi:hypothetical protein VP1G_03652 [Cytospora mali]|uniref:ASST-domain-containing protein n=1 Tax=Cytospora mali TaxID=578113 RepID=A0A194UX18_CYTMA|nr:hypothetical protein VP1G_03652 [Valsa mali var. pyri (nom. inval.)]
MPLLLRQDDDQWPGPGRLPFYYSRPDLRPPRLNVIHRDPKRASPGYILVSPAFSGRYRPDSGPYIFDTINGDGPHLCFWRGQQRDAHGVGVGVIMSQNYTVVKTVSSFNTSPAGIDLHEFRLTPDNTALITTYRPRFIDGLWVLDSCFEEVTVDSTFRDKALFQWCATDHISLDENPRRKDLSSTHKGKTPDRAWDYVHLNSVDKSPSGDYLISARHLDCIMLHDARFVSELGDGGGTIIISLYNNRNDGGSLGNHPSSGLILKLNLESGTAKRVSEYGRVTAPISESSDGKGEKYISANGMGNLQTLPNGHVLTNFGQHGAVAEYPSEGGDPMFYANLLSSADPDSSSSSLDWKANNYRAFLYPFGPDGESEWIGQPTTPPDLWTYARTPQTPQSFYVSWNGDTRTAQYRFWVSDVGSCPTSSPPPPPPGSCNNPSQPPADDTFHHAATWPRDRTSFETNFTAEGRAYAWSFAEALDSAGVSLANSSKVRTYIPTEGDSKACGELHCFPGYLRDEDVIPLDEYSSAVLGVSAGEGKGGGGTGLGGVWGVLEHGFALFGLGLCAWWVLGRICIGWRDFRSGYGRVGGDKDERREVVAGFHNGVHQMRMQG